MPILFLSFHLLLSAPVSLSDSTAVSLQAEHVERFLAETPGVVPGQAAWDDLPAKVFAHIPPRSRLELGRNSPPTLLKVGLRSPRPGRWWLVSTLRTPSRMEARLQGDSLGCIGSAVPFRASSTGTFDQAISLDLRSPTETLFLEVSDPQGPCNLGIQFVPDRIFAARAQFHAFTVALIVGYLGSVLLIAAYLWWAIRERAFGWYTAYLASAIGWTIVKQGVAFTWIWPDHPQWNPHASPSLAYLCVGFLSLFLTDLLELRKHLPAATRILSWLTGLVFSFSVVCWSDWATRTGFLRHLADTTLLAVVVWLLACLALRAFRKDHLAIQISIAFLPLALGLVFGALVEFGFGRNGPELKSNLVAVSALLENTLTILVLVRIVHHREKLRVALERQFHQRVVERSDEHLGKLAQELHDDLSQQASSLRMRLYGLRRSIASPEIDDVEDRVDRLSGSIRRLSHQIHPPLLEHGNLGDSISQLCQELTDSSSAEVVFLMSAASRPIPHQAAVHLYRIVQEACVNALRHGQASRVEIGLGESPGVLHLVVADNGRGFVPGAATGIGLWSIRSRAETLGGTLRISSAKGVGTRLEIDMPT